MATILLVEDEAGIRKKFREALADEGYRVIGCATLAEGREIFFSIKAQLVVIDGDLSDGNGAEWAEELFASRQNVLLVSATAQSQIVPVLRKPAEEAEMISTVKELLRACEV